MKCFILQTAIWTFSPDKNDRMYISVLLHNIKNKHLAFLNLDKGYTFKQSKNPMYNDES